MVGYGKDFVPHKYRIDKVWTTTFFLKQRGQKKNVLSDVYFQFVDVEHFFL